MRAGKGHAGKGLSIAGLCTASAALLMSLVYLVLIGASVDDDGLTEINTDPANGVCDPDRHYQDPDC